MVLKHIVAVSTLLLSLQSYSIPWNKTNLNTIMASVCNLNTNYTNTGKVEEDLFLHDYSTNLNSSEVNIYGACSGRLDSSSNVYGAYSFNVRILKSHFSATRKPNYLSLLGYIYNADDDIVRSFEIQLTKKSTKIVNGRIQKQSHMEVSQVVVYPYLVPIDKNMIDINSPMFIESIQRSPMAKVEDWIVRNLKAYNILRIPFQSMQWKTDNKNLKYRVAGPHSLRGYTYKQISETTLSQSSFLLLNEVNLLDFVKKTYRGNKSFATDVFMGIGSSRVKGCSYANNDDGSKDSRIVMVGIDDCKSFH